MFNFIKINLPPGESYADSHHLGVRIWNPSTTEAQIKFTLGGVALELPLPAHSIITETNEQSAQAVVIENMGEQTVEVEWKKSRD